MVESLQSTPTKDLRNLRIRLDLIISARPRTRPKTPALILGLGSIFTKYRRIDPEFSNENLVIFEDFPYQNTQNTEVFQIRI